MTVDITIGTLLLMCAFSFLLGFFAMFFIIAGAVGR